MNDKVTPGCDKVTPGPVVQWFGHKKTYQFFNAKKACPLSFYERMVHTFVAYRSLVSGTSIKGIARATGLHRATVRKALGSLVAHLLVVRDSDTYIAVQPPHMADGFSVRPKPAANWQRRLRSFPIAWTPMGWTPAQTALYFCAMTGNVQDGLQIRSSQKKAGLAAMLSLSRRTVLRAWAKLTEAGLISKDNYLVEPSAEVLALFADKPKKEMQVWRASRALGWNSQQIDNYSNMMLAANYTKNEIIKYWETAWDWAGQSAVLDSFLSLTWEEIWHDAERVTLKNRSDGRFHARNSAGLLLEKTKEAIRIHRQNHIIETFSRDTLAG